MAGEWHGRGMGTAWARHAMCESVFILHIITQRINSQRPAPEAMVFYISVSGLIGKGSAVRSVRTGND